MVRTKSFRIISAIIVLAAFLVIRVPDVFAHPPRRGPVHPQQRDYYHNPALPLGYLAVRIADAILYYYEGRLYKPTPRGYVVVREPVEIVVKKLPRGHKRFYRGGRTYYHYNNVYYMERPNGYVIVDAPF